ncbi:MAG: hypothetical protein ACXVI1_10580 [Halobacteriota archaeon]
MGWGGKLATLVGCARESACVGAVSFEDVSRDVDSRGRISCSLGVCVAVTCADGVGVDCCLTLVVGVFVTVAVGVGVTLGDGVGSLTVV